MKETQIDIAEILKDCPAGTKLYSPTYGYVYLKSVDFRKVIDGNDYIEIGIKVELKNTVSYIQCFNEYGKIPGSEYSECMLFPSKDQRDWSKFVKPHTAPFEINRMHGFTYYYINGTRYYNTTDDSVREDDYNWENGNYFNTEEQAKYAAKKVKELLLSLRKEAGNE